MAVGVRTPDSPLQRALVVLLPVLFRAMAGPVVRGFSALPDKRELQDMAFLNISTLRTTVAWSTSPPPGSP